MLLALAISLFSFRNDDATVGQAVRLELDKLGFSRSFSAVIQPSRVLAISEGTCSMPGVSGRSIVVTYYGRSQEFWLKLMAAKEQTTNWKAGAVTAFRYKYELSKHLLFGVYDSAPFTPERGLGRTLIPDIQYDCRVRNASLLAEPQGSKQDASLAFQIEFRNLDQAPVTKPVMFLKSRMSNALAACGITENIRTCIPVSSVIGATTPGMVEDVPTGSGVVITCLGRPLETWSKFRTILTRTNGWRLRERTGHWGKNVSFNHGSFPALADPAFWITIYRGPEVLSEWDLGYPIVNGPEFSDRLNELLKSAPKGSEVYQIHIVVTRQPNTRPQMVRV